MKLILPFLFITTISFSQTKSQASGFVANGVVYTLQTMDLKNDIPLSEKDTLNGEFNIVVSATKKFINIDGIPDINPVFKFDSIEISDLMTDEYLGEIMKLGHYTQRKEFDFKVDYYEDIFDGKKRPVVVKWMYDDLWNSPKLYISYTQSGKNWFYNFYFEDISYIGWDHGLTYEYTYNFSEYGETDSKSEEEVEIFKANDAGTFVVNDTSMVITSEQINLKKNITRSFASSDKNIFMVQGALFSIPKYLGNWIFYSFDYNADRKAFDGYYYFGIKEEEE